VHVEAPAVAPVHKVLKALQPTAVAETVKDVGKMLAPTAVGVVTVVVEMDPHYGTITLAVTANKTPVPAAHAVHVI